MKKEKTTKEMILDVYKKRKEAQDIVIQCNLFLDDLLKILYK